MRFYLLLLQWAGPAVAAVLGFSHVVGSLDFLVQLLPVCDELSTLGERVVAGLVERLAAAPTAPRSNAGSGGVFPPRTAVL
jgi:hypothetical protein